MKLEQIHPNPKNPRFLRKEKSEWLEDSLNEFGDLSGYVFNKDGMIISAHQRWEKIRPKVKEVVVRETFKKPLPDGTIERGHFELKDGTKHDYSVRDWTPEKADRATIRANAQNAGEWDADVLANQWEYEPDELQEMGVPEYVFGDEETVNQMKEGESVELDQAIQLKPPREYVMIICDDENSEWAELQLKLNLQPVRRGGYKKGSTFDSTGTQRVVLASEFLKLLK